MVSLSDLYQLRKTLTNCAVPPSDADFDILANRLGTVLASLDNSQQQGCCDDDSTPRRSLLASLGRFVQLDLFRRQFKCIGHPLVKRICGIIFNGMRNATFTNDKVWFGGVSSIQTFTTFDLATNSSQSNNSSTNVGNEDRSQMRQNSVLYFALGLTLVGFYEKIDEIIPPDTLGQFFTKLDQMYAGSPHIFMDALLENDERCLQTMAAVQRIYASESGKKFLPLLADNRVPTIASPDILALSLLRKIHFDPLVIIDWVSSEPELCFVFLKQFSHRFSQLMLPQQLVQLSAIFVKTLAKVDCECRFQIVHHQQQQQNLDADNTLQFSIEELHGQQAVLRNVIVPTKTNCTIQQRHGTDLECSAVEMCQQLVSFCAKLRHKLCTLSKHLYFPQKAICANLKQFLDNANSTAFAEYE